MCDLCRQAGLNEAEVHGAAGGNPYLDDAPRIYAENPIFNKMENFGDGVVVRVWDMSGWFMDVINIMFGRATNVAFVSEPNFFKSDIWFNEQFIDGPHGALGAAFNSSSSSGIIEVKLDIYDIYKLPADKAGILIFHELCHAVGLAHVRETDGSLSGYETPYTSHLKGPALMEPYLRDVPHYGEHIKEKAALQYLYGAPAVYVSRAGDADEVLFARTAGSEIRAGGGDDYVVGREHGAGADVFHGEGGADLLIGFNGDDTLIGGDGSDSLRGGADDDILHGGNDDDSLDGGAGADILYGNKGLDLMLGGDGSDTLYGGQNAGAPRATATDPRPRMRDGVETLRGGAGDDALHGNRGSDELFGETGSDTLYGGQDNDTVDGGRGNDALFGEEGDDLLRGGSGADVFHFSGGGADTVADFDPAEGDRLLFPGPATGAGAGPGGHLRIHHAGGTVDLPNVAPEQWDPAWALPVA